MKYHKYTDPAHGWLKVPYKKLVELGIENEISEYSFMRGEYAYLEEDADLTRFKKALEANGETLEYELHIADKCSRIRNYKRYSNLIVGIAIDTEEKYEGLMKFLGWPIIKPKSRNAS